MKKIVVAVNFEESTLKTLAGLKNMDFKPDLEIHLIHVFPQTIYTKDMQFALQTSPSPEEQPKVEKSLVTKLEDIRKTVLPDNKNVICKCLFDPNPKAAFTEYVKSEKADLVVVATRARHGMFDSSFAQDQLKHSPAKLLVLR